MELLIKVGLILLILILGAFLIGWIALIFAIREFSKDSDRHG